MSLTQMFWFFVAALTIPIWRPWLDQLAGVKRKKRNWIGLGMKIANRFFK